MKPSLYLLNGPLGAGKTTLLGKLLARPEFASARIIQNEFASTSVDTETLHEHTAEIQTIAGVCICCSTGDELTDALLQLATSSEPVIIEATGVANSLKLVEQLALGGALQHYELRHALFVLDAAELAADLEHTLSQHCTELQAADLVLLSKTDLITKETVALVTQRLTAIGARRLAAATEGSFDYDLLLDPSHITEFFLQSEAEIANHDGNLNYSVHSTANLTIEESDILDLWVALQHTYGLRRMKGDIQNTNGQTLHIEATPSQCRVTHRPRNTAEIVCIGADARSITSSALQQAIAGVSS